MTGFTNLHVEAERDITERGLEPFRVRFTLHIHEVKAPRHLRNKTIVIACERKKQIAVTKPKQRAEESGDDILVNENIDLNLVLARRGSYADEDLTRSKSDALDASPLQGFETVMAQITLRQGDVNGTVLDCASLNLAKYVTGRHSLSRMELVLQLGGTLEITVEAQIFDQKTQVETSLVDEDGSLHRVASGGFASSREEDQPNPQLQELDIDGLQPATESVFAELETDKNASDDGNGALDDDKSWHDSNTDSLPDKDELEPLVADDPNVHFSKQAYSESGLLSACTTESEYAAQEVHYDGDISGEHVQEDEDGKDGTKGNVRQRISHRQPGGEYSTVYSGGTWVEDASIVEVETPRKLIFWSIHGPDEYESDDEDSDCEGLHKKHNQMTVSSIKPGRPAQTGKLSSLQKSVMMLEKPAPPHVIELGGPISLVRSTVLAATKFLVHDVQYIDEPPLSDSDDKNEDEDIDNENDYSSSDESSEIDLGAKLESIKSSNIRPLDELENALDDTGGDDQTNEIDITKVPSKGDSDEDRIGELTFQLREMEKYIRQLQDELKISLLDNSKLTCKLQEGKGVKGLQSSTDESSRKTSFKSHSSEAELDSENKIDGHKQMCERSTTQYSGMSTVSVTEGTKEYIEMLRRELEAEQQKNRASRKEHDRLLRVIEKLSSELNRDPEAADVVKQLTEAKMQLATEREERQKLESIVLKLQGKSKAKDSKSEKKKGFFGLPGGKSKSSKPLSSSSKKRRSIDSANRSGADARDEFGSPRSVLV